MNPFGYGGFTTFDASLDGGNSLGYWPELLIISVRERDEKGMCGNYQPINNNNNVYFSVCEENAQVKIKLVKG